VANGSFSVAFSVACCAGGEDGILSVLQVCSVVGIESLMFGITDGRGVRR